MSKKYDLSKKSDMARFIKDLESVAIQKATEAAMEREYSVTCPHCSEKVSIAPGRHPCPQCHSEINLTLDIKS